MIKVRSAALPQDALLATCAASGAYIDCYTIELARPVAMADFIFAFYTTSIFRIERWILARTLGAASTDEDVRRLADAETNTFAAWHVEARQSDQILLAAGRTRSWLMVAPQAATVGPSTVLYFGSAVLPRLRGGLGWHFKALLGFHRLYSRILLGLAVRRLSRVGG